MIPKPELKTILVKREDVSKFIFTDYKRIIRERAVGRLNVDLQETGHFKNPIHLNEINGEWRIIDGNHRIEAVRRFFESPNVLKAKKEAGLTIPLAIYKNLSVEEERVLYDQLARVVTQSLTDFIKIHFDEVPIFKRIDNNFPFNVSIYGTEGAVKFQTLFEVWASKENEIIEQSGRSKEEILEKLKEYTDRDYHEMLDYFKQYVNIFGMPAIGSPYYKTGTLWITTSIYFRNFRVIDQNELWKFIKEKLFQNLSLMECAALSRNRSGLNDRRRIILAGLNEHWDKRKNKLL